MTMSASCCPAPSGHGRSYDYRHIPSRGTTGCRFPIHQVLERAAGELIDRLQRTLRTIEQFTDFASGSTVIIRRVVPHLLMVSSAA